MNQQTARTIAFVISALLMFGAAAGFSVAVKHLKLYLIKLPIEAEFKVSSVPAETNSWKQVGVDEAMPAEMVQELGTQNYLTRAYIEKDPPQGRPPRVLQMHLAYYTGMVDTVPHIPDRCLVGGGWSIAGDTKVIPLAIDRESTVWQLETVPEEKGRIFSARLGSDSRRPGSRVRLPRDADELRIRVNPYTDPKQGRTLYAGYFFIANGGHCSDAETVRLLAFQLTDSYAYYLKVQFSTDSVTSTEEFGEAVSSLLSELLPDIMLCVPDWVEVLRGDYPPDNPRRPAAPIASSGAGRPATTPAP